MNNGKMSCYLLQVRQENRCVLSVKKLSQNRRHDLKRRYKIHQTEIEGKLELVLGSELRKEYMTKKKEEIRIRQNLFTKISCESLAMIELSYGIA